MSQNNQALRIAVVISPGIAAPYILLDFADALESLGHTVMRLETRPASMLPKEEHGRAVQGFKKELQEFAPQLALAYGANAIMPLPPDDPDYSALHVFEALGVPYCSLLFDSPFYYCGLSMIQPFVRSPRSTVFIWDRYYLERFRKLIGPAHYLPLAVNPDRFKPGPPSPEFEADVAFIGSVAETRDFDTERRAQQWPRLFSDIARAAVDMMRKTGACLDDVLDGIMNVSLSPDDAAELASMKNTNRYDVFLTSVYGEAGAARRLEAVAALAPLGMRVYGGPGWKILSGQISVHGTADYFNDVPRIYASTKINVNISSPQLVTSVNQRVFDVPACGAFLLTDMRKDAAQLFEPNKEIVQYRSPLDMRKKAEYFLAHEDERQAIADRARERVLREHTYVHRAQTVLDVVRSKGLIP